MTAQLVDMLAAPPPPPNATPFQAQVFVSVVKMCQNKLSWISFKREDPLKLLDERRTSAMK